MSEMYLFQFRARAGFEKHAQNTWKRVILLKSARTNLIHRFLTWSVILLHISYSENLVAALN